MGPAMVTESATRLDTRLRRELGKTILTAMEDVLTEDIVVNPDGRLWIYQLGKGWVQLSQMSAQQVYNAVGTVASSRGTVINHEHPILETDLPLDGSRFEALVPPVVRRPVFAIRLRPRKIFALADYQAAGILTHKEDPLNHNLHRKGFAESVHGLGHSEIICKAVQERRNILIAGSTGSGKTTVANAVLHAVAMMTPNDRVITVEDTTELQCAVKNAVDLRAIGTDGPASLDRCVRACLRMRPTRIVVGEVRGGEALELLKAWATGHPGGVVTVHGMDARGGLLQLENLISEATSAPKQTLIAETIHLVISIDQDRRVPAGRKIREVAVVTGYEDGQYRMDYV